MRSVILIVALASLSGSCSGQQTHFYCGKAFALELKGSETVTSRSPVEDFVLHDISSGTDQVIVYEGNAPQSGGIRRRTGLDWPGMVVVHARSPFGRDIAKRLKFGAVAMAQCPKK